MFAGSFVGPVGAAVHVDVVGGVDESVEDGFGDDGVREEWIPVFGAAVGGDHDGSVGAFGDEFVEVVGLGGSEFAHGEIVEDEQFGSCPFPESCLPGAVGVAAGEVGEKPAGFGERDAVSVAAGVMADGLRDEGFPDADGSVKKD